MRIPIKTDIKYFYKALLTMMSKFPPIVGLSPTEIRVLAEIMLQNYLYKDIEIAKRHFMIFSTKNRIVMQDNLNMSFNNFNNYLHRLRGRGIVTKDNKLMPFLNILPKDKYDFIIAFEIDKDE